MAAKEKEKKNKKISKMTLSEIEEAIRKATESMNGSTALYIQHLKQRKEELLAKNT